MVVSLKLKEAEDTGQYSLPLVYFPSLRLAGEPSDLVSIFHHPRVVEAELTEHDSLLLTRNFLATAMSNRGLFYLNDEDMKLIMAMDTESHLLIEKGVCIGLLRKYFIFCTCETVDEEHTFFSRDSYSNSQAVMLNIGLTENKSHGGTFKSTADVTLNQLRSSSFKMLCELMSTIDTIPDEPQDYKPPFFWGCLENEAQYLVAKNPLRVEVGNVNSKRLVLTLKISHSQGNYLERTDVFSSSPHLPLAISEDIMDQIETEVVISETGKDTYVKNRDKGKSVVEPCEYENDFMQDDGKRTRQVTKNARCNFFAEGFCPFGDECWFSHHVGGDGNSCCIFSCEASSSYSKGKSVLEPYENENYFMQDDGKRTRPVTTKNARCKFFAEGFCPFGDECWFSHHFGGDGNSFCIFSSEASGSYSKGKSVLEPYENENYFMQDDGKRTRPVTTKNARCKFFAEGFCPFGDDCWFSHHVGGDGNSFCIFSSEASGSYSKGKSVLEPYENENYFMQDEMLVSYSKGKSVLEPYENENYFMQDDGERTRLVTKNARCKFFAEGFSCPFEDECWFSHHVGGDGNSCCIFSCEASGSYTKGKSVLEPRENKNDDGKRTRQVTKNARCKFFAEGFCPFGDECWFSHHVGGDGNSCCVFSCEASGSYSKGKSVLEPCENENYLDTLELVLGRCCWDTSVSKVYRKPELSLAGVTPRSYKNILETAKKSVRAHRDHALTPSDLKNIFGQKLYDMCYKKEGHSLPAISCWFEKFRKEADNTIYENQLFCWRSSNRSPNWGEGVTRVDRKWVELSEEDKKKAGPIRSEQEDKMVGNVRDQGDHELCSAYVCVNLVSSLRVIEGLDDVFVNLSVKELCFYASPHDRSQQALKGHKCHAMLLTTALKYIKDHGVTVQRGAGDDSFNCVTDKPKERKEKKIKIADYKYIGNDLQAALKRLETQPIGATLEIYRGPTSDNSCYEALHGVTIVDAFLMNGELVFWCKSSHGTEPHDKGYILVSAEMMVMGHHFAAGRGDSTFGVNRGVGGDTALALSRPKGLIHEFVYPVHMLESSARKRKR